MLVSTPGRQAGIDHHRALGQRHLLSATDERTTAVGFWDFFWLMLWGYVFIAYLMVLFQVIMDVFRDRSINGWTRVIWLIALFIAPPVTALIYLIARGKGMGERQRQVASDSRAAAEEYVRSIAGATDPAESIQRAKALLDSGAISAAEYETLKAKALSS
jgi:hypothetical protein